MKQCIGIFVSFLAGLVWGFRVGLGYWLIISALKRTPVHDVVIYSLLHKLSIFEITTLCCPKSAIIEICS